ncbi:MAG: endolytic transglycosylase MltG [Elusimicrobia bacterium]|nr:endolytic transglycosylase MltG [Elusimicrobiota bacterium]
MRRLLLSLAALGTAAMLLLWWLAPPGLPEQVDIPPGATASGTAALLKGQGIIRSVFVFKAIGKLTGWDRRIRPGLYDLRAPMGEPIVLWRLHEGKVTTVRVAIPEGFMAKQIADRLDAEGVTDAAGFMKYVRANNLEGYLFPTTYIFARNLPPEAVAHHMYEQFQRQVRPVVAAAGETRFTLAQVVTLASIVQREARAVDEMPTIAAVYRNRLAKRMRLEADPTVQYAHDMDTGEWRRLHHRELAIDSPYNTYLYFGLPPGPICSPGLDAVKAALHPAQSDALYFVADGDTGRHIFSRTFAEHAAAIERSNRDRRRERRAGR